MKIFIDTANLEEIKELNALGIIDGVTTNPSLISREGQDMKPLVMEICKTVNGPVSVEVLATDTKGMVEQARKYAKWHKNIVIKIPLTEPGLAAVKTLSREGIRVNVTLIFSASQALLAAKAGAAYVSPFIGRLDDISNMGMVIVMEMKEIFDNYNIKSEIIAASIRHPMHVVEAARIGADIATIPPKVIRQLMKHPLTDVGLKRFLDDWKKAGIKVG